MRAIIAATLIVLSGVAAADAPKSGSMMAPAIVDLCNSLALSALPIGGNVSLRGVVHSDIEASWLYGERCHDVTVKLAYKTSGPSLVACLSGHADARCGGLRHNDQVVVVTGVLLSMRPAEPAPLPLSLGEVRVTAFRVVE
jgi:hypothetical protein